MEDLHAWKYYDSSSNQRVKTSWSFFFYLSNLKILKKTFISKLFESFWKNQKNVISRKLKKLRHVLKQNLEFFRVSWQHETTEFRIEIFVDFFEPKFYENFRKKKITRVFVSRELKKYVYSFFEAQFWGSIALLSCLFQTGRKKNWYQAENFLHHCNLR